MEVTTALPHPITPLRHHIVHLPPATAAHPPPTAAMALPSRRKSPCSQQCSSEQSMTPGLRPFTPQLSPDRRFLYSPSTPLQQGVTPSMNITAAMLLGAGAAVAIMVISTTTTVEAVVTEDLEVLLHSPIIILQLLLAPRLQAQHLRVTQPHQTVRAQRTTAPRETCCHSLEKVQWACTALSLLAHAGP